MTDNDPRPIINTVLGTDKSDVSEFSIKELQRACLIVQINALLYENPDIEIFTCRKTGKLEPRRVGAEMQLFYELETDSLFLENGQGATLRKTERGTPVDCICTDAYDKAYYNALDGQARVHVCPDTPVTEA